MAARRSNLTVNHRLVTATIRRLTGLQQPRARQGRSAKMFSQALNKSCNGDLIAHFNVQHTAVANAPAHAA
jgi:hypothetical protein